MCLNNSRNPNHTLIELAWSPCTTLLQRGWEEGVVNWWASGLMFFSLFKLHFALSHFSFTLRPQWRRPDCWSFLTFPLPAKIHQCQVFHESLKKRETDPLFASKTLFRFRIFGTLRWTFSEMLNLKCLTKGFTCFTSKLIWTLENFPFFPEKHHVATQRYFCLGDRDRKVWKSWLLKGVFCCC